MYLCGTFVGGLICVALKLLIVKSERSNYAQVLREFPVPKNSFHMSPRVLKAYFKSLMNLASIHYVFGGREGRLRQGD